MQPQPQTAGDSPTPPRGMALPQAQPSMPNWRREQRVVHRDDTTRFLCVAAHVDGEFADDAIREFLVEPTRAVAPSPGIDAWQVLDQAVAARSRRKVRDGVLCVLAPLSLVLLVLSGESTVLMVGILLGVLLGALNSFVRDGEHAVLAAFFGRTGSARRRSLRLLLAVLGGAEIVFALGYSITKLFTVGGGPASWLLSAVIVLGGMLIVLVVDEITVWRLVTNRFRSVGVPTGSGASQRQNGMPNRFAAALAQYQSGVGQQAAPDSTPVTVYRGYHPFVGAGKEFQPWSMAIPLQRKEEEDDSGGRRTQLTTDVLYRSVREEIAKLKRATPLSPSRRLAELRILDQVVVPTDELVDHYLAGDEQAAQYLPGLDSAPAPFVSRQQADIIAANSEEWARYYLCLQIETWDRDLVVSIFIHFAMDDETLYIEWTPCVLLPIKPEYRRIDGWSPSPVTPVMQAIGEWVTLPATIFGRAARALGSLRPLPQGGVRVNPDRYGALRSLREMAAADDVQSYFQLLDIERYRKIVQSRFNLTVGRILDEHGYSSQLFRRQAATMITNNNFLGGNFAGPIVTGGTTGTVGGGTVNSGDSAK